MKPKISKTLKELRALNKKTQGQVAEVLGISRQAYSRYESSSREPSLEALVKLAEYYDVSPQIFFMGTVDKEIDSEMDIVELSAIYQAKKVALSKQDEETKTTDSEENHEDLKSMKEILFTKLDYDVKLEDLSDDQRSELSDDVEENEVIVPLTKKKKKLKTIKMVLFYILILLALFNIGIMTIHKMDPRYEYPTFDHSFINAISPGQNISQTMYTNIVKITKFNVRDIAVGDNVVIYSDFGIDEYWVEEVVSIDVGGQTITTTYDEATTITVPFNEILGKYDSGANILGTIYYSSKFNMGYIFIMTGHGLILAFIYYSFIDRRGSRW